MEEILFLKSAVQHYHWGRIGSDSIVARLCGEAVDEEKPYAELWVGVHPKGPSSVIGPGSASLEEKIKGSAEEFLGDAALRRFGPTLPFLFKVLSIGAPLSIQAHPDKETAQRLHKSNPEHYPDANHKPEIAIALTKFQYLCGFRAPRELAAQIERHGELMELVGETLFQRLKSGDEPESVLLREAYERIVRMDSRERGAAVGLLADRLREEKHLSAEDEWFLRFLERYGPEDRGVPAPYLFQLGKLSPGEAIFLPANTPHAYLQGEIVECMANSDNVIRAGLTPKYQDLETLLSILHFCTSPVSPQMPQPDSTLRALEVYRTAAVEFEVSRVASVELSTDQIELPCPDSLQLLFSVDGTGEIETTDGPLPLSPGSAALVPASVKRCIVQLRSGTLYRVVVP